MPPVGPQASTLSVTARDQYLVPLWENAAELLNTTFPVDDGRAFLEAFYHQMFAWASTREFPATHVQYIPIWKAANDAIRCNLQEAKEAVACELPKDNPDNVASPGAGDAFRFTLVREPLSRFVSGVSEINLRTNGSTDCKDENVTFTAFTPNSISRAFAFVQDLVSARIRQDCQRNWHVFSMLGPILEFQGRNGAINLIGKLENLKEVWLVVQKIAGCSFPVWDDTCGAHPKSSDEDYGPRRTISNVLSFKKENAVAVADALHGGDPKLKSALVCAVYLPDYVCLNYDLGAMADDCIHYNFASSRAEWELIVTGIRTEVCPDIGYVY